MDRDALIDAAAQAAAEYLYTDKVGDYWMEDPPWRLSDVTIDGAGVNLRGVTKCILDAIAPAIRAAALEEAAERVEAGVPRAAAAIRALINDPPPTP
jgi:hypothetical protein